MNGRLQAKVVIVTGGGTGIGEAICREFAREGAKVVVNGLPGDPIADVATAILRQGGEAVPVEGDVAEDEHARDCIQAAIKHYGKLDVLINNAGILVANVETDDMPVDVFDEHVRCNIRTAFLMTKYALPHLRQGKGTVISAGSEGGVNGQPRNTYGGTKAFLHAFMMGRGGGAGALWRAGQLRLPGPYRHGVDPQKNRRGGRNHRAGIDHCHAAGQAGNARGSRQRLCLSRLGRRTLCHRSGLAGGRRHHACKRSGRRLGWA